VISLESESLLNRLSSLEGRVAITAFGNPDPDAISSAYGLARILDHYGIDHDVLFESEINRPENQLLVNYLEIEVKRLDQYGLSNYQHVSLVDCNPARVDKESRKRLREELDQKLLSVQDHHPIEEETLEELKGSQAYIDIRPDLGSCSTMLAECIDRSELDFDSRIATSLFYGLHSDTNGLLRGFSPSDFEQITNYAGYLDMEAL